MFTTPETVIGFLELQYNAAENAGPITFNIGVISGELRIDVPFSFSTSDITSSLNRAEGIYITSRHLPL